MVTPKPSQVTLLRSEARLRSWGARLAHGGAECLPATMSSIAGEIRDLVGSAPPLDRWQDLGISVRAARLHGRRGAIGPGQVVYVMAGEPENQQRWIAAHEVGHLLVDAARDQGLVGLLLREEERACDEFADVMVGVAVA